MSLTYLYNKFQKMDKWEQYGYIQNIFLQFKIKPKYDLITCLESFPKNPLGYLVMHLSRDQLDQLIPQYLRTLVGQSTFGGDDDIIFDTVDFAMDLINKKLSPNLRNVEPGKLLQVFEFGATKYKEWDFLNLNPYILVPAIFRHIYKYYYVSKTDEESGLDHMAHVDSNLRMICLINERNK